MTNLQYLLVGEEYDKQLRRSKKGFGATQKASFVGWDTPARRNRLDVSESAQEKRRPMFCATNVTRKFQDCSEFGQTADSVFPAKSAQFSRRNAQITATVCKSVVLNRGGSCM